MKNDVFVLERNIMAEGGECVRMVGSGIGLPDFNFESRNSPGVAVSRKKAAAIVIGDDQKPHIIEYEMNASSVTERVVNPLL